MSSSYSSNLCTTSNLLSSATSSVTHLRTGGMPPSRGSSSTGNLLQQTFAQQSSDSFGKLNVYLVASDTSSIYFNKSFFVIEFIYILTP